MRSLNAIPNQMTLFRVAVCLEPRSGRQERLRILSNFRSHCRIVETAETVMETIQRYNSGGN